MRTERDYNDDCCDNGHDECYGDCRFYDIHIHPHAPTFDVDSGYAGLTMYRLDAIRGTGCAFEGTYHCEIVTMMDCLRARGLRIGLAPSLISGCGREHTDGLRAYRNWVKMEAKGNSFAALEVARMRRVTMGANGSVSMK